MTFLVWLHVLAVILTIGPVTVATSAAPRAARAGADGLPVLRWLYRTTRWYGLGTLAVIATGAAVVPADKDVSFSTAWLSAAMAMFVVMFLLLLFVAREQRKAITTIEAGGDAAVEAGRMSAVSGFAALLWLAILVLMIFHPGSH